MTTGISPSSNDSCKPSGPPVTARRSSATRKRYAQLPAASSSFSSGRVRTRRVPTPTTSRSPSSRIASAPACSGERAVARTVTGRSAPASGGCGEHGTARGDRLRGPTRARRSGVNQTRSGEDAGMSGGGQEYVVRCSSAGPKAPTRAATSATNTRSSAARSRRPMLSLPPSGVVMQSVSSGAPAPRDRATVSALGAGIECSSRGVCSRHRVAVLAVQVA